MGVFYEGPAMLVPSNEYNCTFGKWGWAGRATKDAPVLMKNSVPAIVLVAATTTIMGVIGFQSGAKEGDTGKVFNSVVGVVIGSLIGLALLAVWSALPWVRRKHWPMRFQVNGFGSPFIVLTSAHWHMIDHLQLEIVSPSGRQWILDANPNYPTFAAKPGDVVGQIDIGAATDHSADRGVYRFRWLMGTTDRSSPIVLAKAKRALSV
jgi:hypothetical protein